MNAAISRLPRLTFGELLRIERTKQGLSHRDIAVRVGVDRALVGRWEANEEVPDRFQLKKLFGTCQRLRHYVHLLPVDTQNQARFDMTESGEAMPKQLAAIEAEPCSAPTTFGEALRLARLRSGLGQDELGELVSVTGQAVSAWETETNTPIMSHYEALCDLMPELRAAPRPKEIRNIDKPDGGRGVERQMTEHETRKEEPTMNVKMIAPTPKLAAEELPALDKFALIRWGRLVHALRSRDDIAQVTDFLAEANDAGLTLEEVIACLADP